MPNFPQVTGSPYSGDLQLTDGGKVGIGTQGDPIAKLHVRGTVLVASDNWVDGGADATLQLGDSCHYIKAVYGSGVRIGSYGCGDAICLKQETGQVGIGTMTPASALDVNGDLTVGGQLIVDENGFLKPKQCGDSSAPNDSIYFSFTQNKLAYKDQGGNVHPLY